MDGWQMWSLTNKHPARDLLSIATSPAAACDSQVLHQTDAWATAACRNRHRDTRVEVGGCAFAPSLVSNGKADLH